MMTPVFIQKLIFCVIECLKRCHKPSKDIIGSYRYKLIHNLLYLCMLEEHDFVTCSLLQVHAPTNNPLYKLLNCAESFNVTKIKQFVQRCQIYFTADLQLLRMIQSCDINVKLSTLNTL